ncbi:MAG: integrase [Hyphomicrobiales bacterium]|nr:MAG: integrase [Hyphomicrobiales bacterium]
MKQAKVLSSNELRRVLVMCAAGRHGQRNRIALLLSHYAGLRVGEIASLHWSDLLESTGACRREFHLQARNTKANETRAVHLNDLVWRELERYRVSCNPTVEKSTPVIPSQKGNAFSANSLCQLFSKLYTEAGISGASSHSGRRWFITTLAHNGISPKVIMELAGHQNLTTTQRYIEVNEKMKQEAVSQLA